MAKTKKAAKAKESDGAYLLKLVLYFLIGSIWLQIGRQDGSHFLSLPIGLIIGLAYAMHDHFQIDRKIEYAVLLIAMVVGLIIHMGLLITI